MKATEKQRTRIVERFYTDNEILVRISQLLAANAQQIVIEDDRGGSDHWRVRYVPERSEPARIVVIAGDE